VRVHGRETQERWTRDAEGVGAEIMAAVDWPRSPYSSFDAPRAVQVRGSGTWGQSLRKVFNNNPGDQ
jgi:hypothetical protein